MGAGFLEDVQQSAVSAVRNLPDAHAVWQSYWRNAWFRHAVGRFVEMIYLLDVEKISEKELENYQEALELVLRAVGIHMSSLTSALRDTVDREYFQQTARKLCAAREALQKGLSPDPAKRPTDDERLERFGAGLRRAKLA